MAMPRRERMSTGDQNDKELFSVNYFWRQD